LFKIGTCDGKNKLIPEINKIISGIIVLNIIHMTAHQSYIEMFTYYLHKYSSILMFLLLYRHFKQVLPLQEKKIFFFIGRKWQVIKIKFGNNFSKKQFFQLLDRIISKGLLLGYSYRIFPESYPRRFTRKAYLFNLLP